MAARESTSPTSVSNPSNFYHIHLKYKTKVDFFKLDRFNIIKASEAVYLDGRRLRRDVDYTIDYTSGFLDFWTRVFSGPRQPGGGDLRVLALRLFLREYPGRPGRIRPHGSFFVGSTFLYSSTQTPIDQPQIGSTPNSLTLLDADTKYDLGPEDIQSLTGLLPGLADWKPPVDVKFSGEVADSIFDPDTYNAEGETGVAMVDSMEGIDNVIGHRRRGKLDYVLRARPVALPQRRRFVHRGAAQQQSGAFDQLQHRPTLPGQHLRPERGHLYAITSEPKDRVQTMEIPDSRLTNQTWAGMRNIISSTGSDATGVKFLESWVYNDGVDKWLVCDDFGTISEDTNDAGPHTVMPGHDPRSTSVICGNDPGDVIYDSGRDQECDSANPGHNDLGIRTRTRPCRGAGRKRSRVFPAKTPVRRGKTTTSLTPKTSTGTTTFPPRRFICPTGARTNWSGWRLVKIPIDLTASEGMHATSDGLTELPQPGELRDPLFYCACRAPLDDGNLHQSRGRRHPRRESVELTKNRWETRVDATAALNQGAEVNPSKFDVTSISKATNTNYDPTLRFIQVASDQNSDTVLSTEKALKVTYNLSNYDSSRGGTFRASRSISPRGFSPRSWTSPTTRT